MADRPLGCRFCAVPFCTLRRPYHNGHNSAFGRKRQRGGAIFQQSSRLRRLCHRIAGYQRASGLHFTREVDDITPAPPPPLYALAPGTADTPYSITAGDPLLGNRPIGGVR